MAEAKSERIPFHLSEYRTPDRCINGVRSFLFNHCHRQVFYIKEQNPLDYVVLRYNLETLHLNTSNIAHICAKIQENFEEFKRWAIKHYGYRTRIGTKYTEFNQLTRLPHDMEEDW